MNGPLEHGEVPTILEGTCGSGNSLIPECDRILVVKNVSWKWIQHHTKALVRCCIRFYETVFTTRILSHPIIKKLPDPQVPSNIVGTSPCSKQLLGTPCSDPYDSQ